MSSPVAFSITWAQLERLRSLPASSPAPADAALMAKGFAAVDKGFLGLTPMRIVRTHAGARLVKALAGLARAPS